MSALGVAVKEVQFNDAVLHLKKTGGDKKKYL